MTVLRWVPKGFLLYKSFQCQVFCSFIIESSFVTFTTHKGLVNPTSYHPFDSNYLFIEYNSHVEWVYFEVMTSSSQVFSPSRWT